MDYILSQHAFEQLQKSGRSQIREEGIKLALTTPDYSELDSRTNTIRVWKRIPDYGDRALGVVYNPHKQPVVIVTVFFDRGFKQ